MKLNLTYPLPCYLFYTKSCFNTHFTAGETEAQRTEFTFLEVTGWAAEPGFRIFLRLDAALPLVYESNQEDRSGPVTLLLTAIRTSNSPGRWELGLS